MIDCLRCKHWTVSGDVNYGRCSKKTYKGHGYGFCKTLNCEDYTKKKPAIRKPAKKLVIRKRK